jgi:hypothetical protein
VWGGVHLLLISGYILIRGWAVWGHLTKFGGQMTLRHWDASFDLPKLFPKGPTIFHIFEANVDPITRLSTDTSVVVSGWVRLAKGSFHLTDR